MRIEFTVPGEPVAQPRAKATTAGRYTRMYTPEGKVQPFKEATRIIFANECTLPPHDGPMRLDVVAVFPRPKSMLWKTKPMPRAHHTVKPDADNVLKAIKDALTKLAWRDDSQVCVETIVKQIAAGDEQPHTRIVIETI